MWAFAHDVILSARFVCALLGAATIPIVYLTAREIGSTRMAIVAATLMALLPGHVQHSHFATVDVPATFFVALSLWLAVRALRKREKFD
jgi:4-amino-4-deoxy-L-arabinose transferase-like glycosyltransferase